jgi:hypothetical protein
MKTVGILLREFTALLCALSMSSAGLAGTPGQDPQQAQDQQQYDQQQQAPDQPLLTPDQLDDLVTPIALYADPLIAQILAASTYPLEVVQADRWLQSNSQLQGTALTGAAAQQPWDPSIQALVVFPSVLSMMDKNLQWTTDLGNAFLAQEQDVMDAVQRQRQRASSSGKLTSNAQQSVQTTNDGGKTIIVVQPVQPDVIYVPVYDPVIIWGPPRWHPWPVFWYPPRPRYGTVIAAGGFGFFIGFSVGRYFNHWGGWNNWGWGCGWGGRNVVINNNFYVVNNYRTPHGYVRNGQSVWAHNPNHRAGVPYPNRRIANRVGYRLPPGRPAGRPPGVRPIPGNPGGGRPGTPGQPNRPGRPGDGRPGTPPGQPNRPGNGQPGILPVPDRPGNGRPGTPGQPNRPGGPGGQPGRPTIGPGNTRPGPRPTDRSAFNGIQTSPGDRAQVERDRGYASLGNRAKSRPAAPAQQRPAPQARPAPQSRPAPSAGQPKKR